MEKRRLSKLILFSLILIFCFTEIYTVSEAEVLIEKNPPILNDLIDHDPIFITHDDNFTDYGFPGTGSSSSPYVIEGLRIVNTTTYGIYIVYTTKFFIIRDCYIDVNSYGISVIQVAAMTATIENNTCCYHTKYGIAIGDSDQATVKNNYCHHNEDIGVYVYRSENTVIQNNTCKQGDWGICIWDTTSCETSENYCVLNNQGIRIIDAVDDIIEKNYCNQNIKDGIYLTMMSNSVILQNNTFNNNEYGMRIIGEESIIKENWIESNTKHGIWLEGPSRYNVVHRNVFIDNNLGLNSQARDDGSHNTWFDASTQHGNWWNDFSGTGNYSIDGDRNSQDIYPLIYPPVEPTTDPTNPTETAKRTFFFVVISLLSIASIHKLTRKT